MRKKYTMGETVLLYHNSEEKTAIVSNTCLPANRSSNTPPPSPIPTSLKKYTHGATYKQNTKNKTNKQRRENEIILTHAHTHGSKPFP